jgi:hypothetical protein
MNREPRIYCPLCEWEPKPESRWVCAPGEPGSGCLTSWNTFWTAGCCPGCGHFWSKTACFRCRQMTPHQDWYHYPPDNTDSVDEEKEATIEHG